MKEEKRYTVKLDAYLYVNSDKEALEKSNEIAEFLQQFEGCQAQVLELNETPFASLSHRKIEI